MTKIIVMQTNIDNKELTQYEAQLIPMIGDLIDVPKLGVRQVVSRVFDVTKSDEIYICVK